MKIPNLILATTSAWLLWACATPEFEQMQSRCQGEGLRQFPVVQQPQVFRRSRQVDVPDGSTVCESQSIESKEKRADMTSSRSVCRPGTRRATEYFDQTEMVDMNSGAREAFVYQCTRDQCMQRYNNVKCKPAKSH